MSNIGEIQKQGKLMKNALIVCNGSPPPKKLLYQLNKGGEVHDRR